MLNEIIIRILFLLGGFAVGVFTASYFLINRDPTLLYILNKVMGGK